MNLKSLTDSELLSKTEAIVCKERAVLTSLLHHLKEIERRKLFSDLKYRSLFDYCVKHLGYSEDQAWRRISAMRLMSEIPEIETKIADGSLTLSNIGLAQKIFREEALARKQSFGLLKNESVGLQLFSEASLKSVANTSPAAALEPLPPKFQTREQKLSLLSKIENTSKREAERIIHLEVGASVIPRERMRELSDGAVEMTVVLAADTKRKLDRLKCLRNQTRAGNGFAELIDQLCDIGLAKLDPMERAMRVENKKKSRVDAKTGSSKTLSKQISTVCASESALTSTSVSVSTTAAVAAPVSVAESASVQTKPPAPAQKHCVSSSESKDAKASDQSAHARKDANTPSQTRPARRAYINSSLRHHIWVRDGGRCTHCGSSRATEIDHIHPVALGGGDTPENLRLLCRNCNQRRAVKTYGAERLQFARL